MTLTHLLEAIAKNELAVSYDGQHVRFRPPDRLTDELKAAIVAHRQRLVWLCLHRIRPDPERPPWEFWLKPEWWEDFCQLKRGGDRA